MKNPTNPREAELQMRRILQKILPPLIRELVNNIRVGVVAAVDTKSRTATVRVSSTGATLTNVKYGFSLTDIRPGDTCVVISPDPTQKSLNYVVQNFRS